MSKAVSSEPFHALASALKTSGFTAHGDRLESILNGTWTTSSELIAELGAAVVSVRDECRPLSAAHKVLIKECLRQVLSVWPGFGFRWLRWFRLR